MFPFYLSIGMSSAEYWEGDSTLARYFRKAYELKQEQNDYNFWQQGMYVYDAVQTALFNGFRGKNQKARSYPDKPYLQKIKEQKKEDAIMRKRKRMQAWMEGLVILYSKVPECQ